MTKKKRINRLARELRKKEYGFDFGDSFRVAKLFINKCFVGESWKWFRVEEEWVTKCGRGCCRGPSGRGLYIRRRDDGSELVWTSDDIKYFENFGLTRSIN
jgi:hypothetical protein